MTDIAVAPPESATGRITGRVIYENTRAPAPGIRVMAQSLERRGWGETKTADDGTYIIANVRPGVYNVMVEPGGSLADDWTAPAWPALRVHAGQTAEGIDLQLTRGALIVGRVTANGVPAAGIQLGVYGPARPSSTAAVQTAVTDDDGAYRLRVPAGAQRVYVMTRRPTVAEGLCRRLTVAEDECQTVDFENSAAPPASVPVTGAVYTATGEPASGALISAAPPFGMLSCRADEAGRFRIEEPFEPPLIVRARLGSLGTIAGVAAIGGEDLRLSLVEDALAEIRGGVLDAGGQPCPGAVVTLTRWSNAVGQLHLRTTAAEDGLFRFPDLWPDLRYGLSATAAGCGHAASPVLAVQPGQLVDLEPLRLPTADQRLTGRVVDEIGLPVAGARVLIRGLGSSSGAWCTDQHGQFCAEGLVAESLSVTAYNESGSSSARTVHAGAADLVLVIRGTEARRENAPVPDRAALIGATAPALQVSGWINAESVSLEEFRGRVLLLDFWAVGCGPCVAALPHLETVSRQLAEKGLVVIGLHAAGISGEELRQFAADRELSFALAIDAAGDGPAGQTFASYRIKGIPAAAVIDQEGRLSFLGHPLVEAVNAAGRLLAAGATPESPRERP